MSSELKRFVSFRSISRDILYLRLNLGKGKGKCNNFCTLCIDSLERMFDREDVIIEERRNDLINSWHNGAREEDGLNFSRVTKHLSYAN